MREYIHMIYTKQQKAFTIVELLIVIVVIAILAAISVVAYNGVQQRAKVSNLASVLKSAEKGFRLYGTEQGVSTWWLDNAFTGSSNPSLAQIISTTNYRNYLQNASLPDGYVLQYDNDGDTYNGCSVTPQGVKIFSYNIPLSVVQEVDNQIDDGNISCGKVTWSSADTALSYYLSNTQTF